MKLPEFNLRRTFGFAGVAVITALVLQWGYDGLIIMPEYITQLAVGLSLIAIGIAYWSFKPDIEKFVEKLKERNEIEEQAMIQHIQKDLLLAYKRLVGIRAENKENKLIFTVLSISPSGNFPNQNFAEFMRELRDLESRTPLDVLTFGKSALKHLEDKKYKDIIKHLDNAKKLVKKYNEDKDESLIPQIDESLGFFRNRLLDEIEQRMSRNILKGKCDGCPNA